MNVGGWNRLLLFGLLLGALGATPSAHAQEQTSRAEAAVEERREEIRERLEEKGLFHDWLGDNPWLSERGILVRVGLTGFAQDPWSGAASSAGALGGKVDALLRFDGQKLGLWEGLSVTVHPEYNFGEGGNAFGGTILPVNLAMQLPGTVSGERYDTSSLFLTQRFGEKVTLVAGKTNLADIAALHPYAGGTGITGFMNGGLAAAPNGAMPPYVYGGALAVTTERVIYSLAAYGGNNAVGGLDITEAFDDGYLLSAGVTVPTRLRDHPGRHSLTVIWGDRELPDLSSLGDLLPPGAVGSLQAIDTKRLLVRYAFLQEVGTWGGDPDRGWGVWGRAQVGDNDLTAVKWSVAGGIGGDSPLSGREGDRWGLGAFYFSFADFLKDPAIVGTPLEDEYGLEVFYNIRLQSWLHVSADLQVIDPGVPDADLAVLAALRTSVRF